MLNIGGGGIFFNINRQFEGTTIVKRWINSMVLAGIQNICSQKSGSRNIAILKNEWCEKDYHPVAMSWHPP